MQEQLEQFVASLAIPAERKPVVLAELLDHARCAMDAAACEGGDPEQAARAALGDLGALRRALEAVEPAFHYPRARAVVRGVIAALLVALVIDRTADVMADALGAVAALAIVALAAPPRALARLRGELGAPRVPGKLVAGARIGPVLGYALAVIAGPPLVWIAIIVARALAGDLLVRTPWSAFTVMVAATLVIAVELARARRRAVA
ncbi:MAG TPA: hypothetical protein VLX92_11130 [Kofleriaceae bacterium]|nr:hypothetical protein [Kofleriaceae bacterium]